MTDDRERIELEHVDVQRLAERLGDARTPAALRHDVHELMSFLPAHFHREERADSPFAVAAARAPAEAWRFDQVRDKHARILEELEDLFMLVEEDEAFQEARTLARSLGEQLLAHERMESTWLRLAFAPNANA